MNIFKVNGSFSISKLFGSLLLTFGAGAIGGFFSVNAPMIYQCLILPPFSPPAWVFGPVWMLLYLIISIAFYRIWMNGTNEYVKNAMFYFIIQLIFNVLWSLLFFGFSLWLAAVLDILILIVYIIITAIKFYKIDKISAYLMLPYLAWVMFATALNVSIVLLNG
jgi:benzodiazapine receptor